MTKKILIILGLYALIVGTIDAQPSKYLELTVEDTLLVDPTSILYQIVLYDKENFAFANQAQTYHLLDKESVEALIKELKIERSTDDATESAASISHPTTSTEFVLLIENIDLLQSVQERLQGYHNVYSDVLEFRCGNGPEVEMDLVKKCIDQGIRKAQKIGELVGKEIGELLALEEELTKSMQKPGPNSTTSWTFHPPLSALPNQGSKATPARTILSKRVKMRFAWK